MTPLSPSMTVLASSAGNREVSSFPITSAEFFPVKRKDAVFMRR